jgi:hypothetical protein
VSIDSVDIPTLTTAYFQYQTRAFQAGLARVRPFLPSLSRLTSGLWEARWGKSEPFCAVFRRELRKSQFRFVRHEAGLGTRKDAPVNSDYTSTGTPNVGVTSFT